MAENNCLYTGACTTLATVVFFNPEGPSVAEVYRSAASKLNLPCFDKPEEEVKKCPSYGLLKALDELMSFNPLIKDSHK